MKYGIQVNIGPPGAPDWRWLQQHDMSSGEWDSKDKATAKMLEWHPNPMKALVQSARDRREPMTTSA